MTNQLRKKLMHIRISTQARSDHPTMDSFFPRFYFLNPLFIHFGELIFVIFMLLLRNKHRVNNYLWGVGFD
jgi:hypothetical protein